MPAYHPQRIEPKWQAEWERNKTFRAIDLDPSRPKLYILDMFPYPSGAGLHVGHPGGLHRHRHLLPLQADAWVQRLAPDGLGRVRTAGRAICRLRRTRIPGSRPRRTSIRFAARSSRSVSHTIGTARSIRPTPTITSGPSGFSSRFMTPGTTRTSNGPTGMAGAARARAGRSPSCRFRRARKIQTPIATRSGWPTGPGCRSTGARS